MAHQVLAKLPWKEILKAALAIITAAESTLRRLNKKPRAEAPQASASDVESHVFLVSRLDALERSEAEQAELVREMAVQMKQLADAVRIVSMRMNLALGGVVALAAIVAWLVVDRTAG